MAVSIELVPPELVEIRDLLPLYRSVGWTNYTDNAAMLGAAVRRSLAIWLAFDDRKLVGLLRAVGDGNSILYVQDLIVHPEYQRQKIGTRLVQAMDEQYAAVYQKVLMTDDKPGTVAFYRTLGYLTSAERGCVALMKVHA